MASLCISLLLLLAGALFALASPVGDGAQTPFLSQCTITDSTPFYLQLQRASANATANTHAIALALFDPYYQTTFSLRTAGPGYASLPVFNMRDGRLHTLSKGPHGAGSVLDYASKSVMAGQPVGLGTGPAKSKAWGDLGLIGRSRGRPGCIVMANLNAKGWSLCEGPLGEEVLTWEKRGAKCEEVRVLAVQDPPY